MKKNILSCLIILIFTCSSFAQLGSSCAEPSVIASLPFTQTGLTTAGLFNYYTSTDACGSQYMTGNDYVFTYTPTIDLSVKVTLTNTYQYGVGVFIINACPNDPLAHCIAKTEGQSGNPVIQNAQLHADSTYYIIVSTWNYSGWIPSTNFNIAISQLLAYDANVAFVNYPKTHCGHSQNEYINVNLRNWGINPMSNFDMAYRINDGPEQITHYNDTVPANGGVYFSYDIPADLSNIGTTYKIQCYSKLAGDLNLFNDTAFVYITNNTTVNVFPYYEDFENGPGNWITTWQAFQSHFTSWELGTPNDTALDHAASGINAWKTNLTGTYDTSEYSFITGPCFDLSALTNPWIDLNIFYELNILDLVTLESSINNGDTWQTVGLPNEGTNWYNIPSGVSTIGWHGYSGTWLTAKHALTGLGGHSKVQLRVLFKAGSTNTNEGVAIDDIKIYEAPQKNIGVVAITEPINGCGHSNSDSVKIKIVNFGLAPQINFDVAYRVNSGTLFTETITDSIYPGDTLVHTFSQTVDLSLPGTYLITCKNLLINDLDDSNDSLRVTIINYLNYSSFPMIMNFESDNGGWYPSGVNSTWEWGAPTDSVIDHAASGANVWKTNLDGRCNEAENSFLTGPCFDLTNLQNPYVKFNIWYENQGFGTIFEISYDGGITWPNLGASSELFWYNIGHNWLGSSGNWVPVAHSLKNYTNINDLQCRFEFKSLIKVHGFAFDDFTICDAPVAAFTYVDNGHNVAFNCSSANATTFHWSFGNGDTSVVQNPTYTFLTDTNTITLITGNDCNTDTITQTIILCDLTTAAFTFTAIWPQINFQCTSLNTTSYNWNFGDGNTSTLQNPSHNFTQDTNIVTLITGNYCSTDTITQIIIRTGMEAMQMIPVSVYPNPATKEVFIDITDVTAAVTIEITDLRGIAIYNEKICKGNQISKINLDGFAKGLYYMKIISGKFSEIKKLIVQ